MSFVSYKDVTIEYNLTRKRVKHLNLRIKHDGSVNVSAPKYVSVKQIDAFVLANAQKILAAKERFAEKSASSPRYRSGEVVMLLGVEYPLAVFESKRNSYAFNDGVVCLYVKNSDVFENRQALFFSLCRDLAEKVFPDIFSGCYTNFTSVCKEKPVLKIRNMKSQWGNCRPQKNVITLSVRLVQYDKDVIRFVVNHEFCHFYEANHSAAFYSRLNAVMPEWKKYVRVLKGK